MSALFLLSFVTMSFVQIAPVGKKKIESQQLTMWTAIVSVTAMKRVIHDVFRISELKKDQQTIVTLRIDLGSRLYDKDGFKRLPEELVLISSGLLAMLEHWVDEEVLPLINSLKARGPYPFKGLGHAVKVSELEILIGAL